MDIIEMDSVNVSIVLDDECEDCNGIGKVYKGDNVIGLVDSSLKLDEKMIVVLKNDSVKILKDRKVYSCIEDRKGEMMKSVIKSLEDVLIYTDYEDLD
ncbi:hypothetical protein CL616_04220 [archaeon]|jgi:hypothetical protein|nr:hypothetical protein [archaeon]MAG78543.1 hypothetical protein [archaeon]|tara:strand:+ start:3050 stop:3343 length:294 start_codon:yes stop_codon:yes gene_type:complete